MGAAGPMGLLLLGEDSMAGGIEVQPARGEGTSRVAALTMAAICRGRASGGTGGLGGTAEQQRNCEPSCSKALSMQQGSPSGARAF